MANATPAALPDLGHDAVTLCQALLRFDTTNPPGNERACAEYLAGKLGEVGYEPVLLEKVPSRTNLVCRYRGTGDAPPLLLATHLDVVEASPARWTHPPFGGVISDGYLFGRGALDMKNMVAMSAAVMRRLARDGIRLRRDVIFAAVADEETGCDLGSRFLVEEHPELVRAEYALGESGGFTLNLGGITFYPVQVAEKGVVWLRAVVRGEPGHGSMPRDDSALIQLAQAAARLGSAQLPVHQTRYVRDFLQAVARRQPAFAQPLLRVLSHPPLLLRIVKLLPDRSVARGLVSFLSNTAAPTIFKAGSKLNVIPDQAELSIDGRTLPGQSEDDLLHELRAVLGSDIDLEIVRSMPPVVTDPVESPLLDVIRAELGRREPEAALIPYLNPGFTDAKQFTRLGARWYGFSPVKLDPASSLRFADMVHGHDERVPVQSLRWGAELLYDVVTRFCSMR